jgi:hypothetical protein
LLRLALLHLDALEGATTLRDLLAAPEVEEACLDPDPRLAIRAMNILAEPALMVGDAAMVRERLQEVVKRSDFADAARAEALAWWARAEWELGRAAEAHARLAEARRLAD